MERVGRFRAAEKKVLEDVCALLTEVRGIASKTPSSATEGVALLSRLRDLGYEDLNQIQHEYLILAAAKWLIDQETVSDHVEWYWNPRQQGGADEPDLRAKQNGRILVSAEITTSRRPIGIIVGRMKATLAKLSTFPGKRFYFVRTESMSKKAKALIKSNRLDITVVCLPHVTGEL